MVGRRARPRAGPRDLRGQPDGPRARRQRGRGRRALAGRRACSRSPGPGPLFKLGIRLGSQRFPRRFAAAGRPGAYLRILAEGEVAAGDPVEVVHRPGHGLTVAEVSRIYHDDHAGAARLLQAPELAGTWKQWAERFVASGG